MGCAFPKVWKTGQVRSSSLVCLDVVLPGQNGIPRRCSNINPLCRGHSLEEVQRLLLILLWLDLILSKLHIYIPISLQPPKTPRYSMTQDEKFILPTYEGKGYPVKEDLTLSLAKELEFFVLPCT